MKADYIENQNPYEYESVRSQPTKTRQVSSRVRNMRDGREQRANKHYKPYNEQYVDLSIVHVCKNVYEIEHELIYEVYAIPNVICSVVPKCEGG